MHASFFKIFFLLCTVAIGWLFLFWSGLLPQHIYVATYGITDALPMSKQAAKPYLQKYEGHWTLTFIPGRAHSPYRACPAFSVITTVRDGRMTGRVSIPGHLLGIEASTTPAGIFDGMFYSGDRHYTGHMSGTVHGAEGAGGWSDSEECFGDWQLVKSSNVIDPIQGRVATLQGRVLLVRGNASEETWSGQALYAGDVIKVPAGASVTLELGVEEQIVELAGQITYAVPDVGGISGK